MKSRKNQRGQAMIESALTMLIIIPTLIGIMDFGQFLYYHQTLSDRARAAARYGAVRTYSNSGLDIVNVAIYNDPTGTANGATALLPNINAPGATPNGSLATVTATLDGTGEDARITVQIQNYPYNFISPFMSKATWYRTVTATEPYEIVP